MVTTSTAVDDRDSAPRCRATYQDVLNATAGLFVKRHRPPLM